MINDDLLRLAKGWLEEDPDPETRKEIEAILEKEDAEALAERFESRLEFGTAGLRGILGAGPNRMNRVVVIRTTAGLADYLLDTLPDARERGVVIGYDGRKLSKEASIDAAGVLTAAGIPVMIFPGVAPTPLTAFAVGHLHAAAGIMITASHNPREYNGYKVYWGNGAQIIPPHDEGISRAIGRLDSIAQIPRSEESSARAAGLWKDIGEEVVDAYLESIASQSITHGGKEKISIVYTPLHGVGGALALRALQEHGFESIFPVMEQLHPDSLFPTVRFPNPEEEGAMDLALSLAKEKRANLVLANDPDADRLAVAVPTQEGEYRLLSGNEIGLLLSSYLLENDSKGGDRLLLTTIVSTPAAASIARRWGVRFDEVLTGFKWIANKAMEYEASTGTRFILGFEEALGYTVGDVCRDKDGIGAAVIFAELAGHAAASGRTVLDELERLWRAHGLYLSHQHGITLRGAEGREQIQGILERLRSEPPDSIGGRKVRLARDYLVGVESNRETGDTRPLSLPSSNVLSYHLEDGSRVIARPSGTEPKIKYYIDVKIAVPDGESIQVMETKGREAIQDLLQSFLSLVGP